MNLLAWACALIGALLLLCLTGCVTGKPLTHETLAHGPFEIVNEGRRISSGGFVNGGSLFSTMEVSSFIVRWQGKEVAVDGHSRFWRVLRLPDAPRPALLLVTSHFRLVYEEQGRLVVKDFGETSGGMAYTQWLDKQQGQPGASAMYGVEKVSMATGTTLRGGRWLRLSDRTVIDVHTLATYTVKPWVERDQPLGGASAGTNATAFAFSPGQTQFVASGSLDPLPGQNERAPALVVIDIPTGNAYGLGIDRRGMRYRDQEDITPAWLGHHYRWQRDAQGHERLVQRLNVKPAPWQGRIVNFGDRVEYRVSPVLPGMEAAFKRFLVERMGAQVAPEGAYRSMPAANTFTLPGCDHVVATGAHDDHVGLFSPSPNEPPWVRCQESIRRVAAAFDAELATGRLDDLFAFR